MRLCFFLIIIFKIHTWKKTAKLREFLMSRHPIDVYRIPAEVPPAISWGILLELLLGFFQEFLHWISSEFVPAVSSGVLPDITSWIFPSGIPSRSFSFRDFYRNTFRKLFWNHSLDSLRISPWDCFRYSSRTVFRNSLIP